MRFCARLTGGSYYSTGRYLYSVLKKYIYVPECPQYRSTGTRFKQIILKGFLRLDLQPVQLISPDTRAARARGARRARRARKNPPALQGYFSKTKRYCPLSIIIDNELFFVFEKFDWSSKQDGCRQVADSPQAPLAVLA